MHLVFSPTLCPDLLLPEVLDLAKAAGFSRLELFRAYTESTPVHRDWSVPMVRTAIAEAGVATCRLQHPQSHWPQSRLQRAQPRLQPAPTRMGHPLGPRSWRQNPQHERRCPHGRGARRPHRRRQHAPRQHPRYCPQLGQPQKQPPPGTGRLPSGDARAAPSGASVLLDTGHLLSVGEPIMPFAEALAGRIGLSPPARSARRKARAFWGRGIALCGVVANC